MQRQLEKQKDVVRFYLFPDDAWYEFVVTEVTETTVSFVDKTGKNCVVCPIETVIAIASELPAHIGRKAR